MNKPKPVIFIMGVAGSGKTTIGKLLSAKTGLPFFDADDFHSNANKEKMKAGQPLTDEDRTPWLQSLNILAQEKSKEKGAIITCSALKEKYRELLSSGIKNVKFIFLQGSFELVAKRLQKRQDHFMPESLLQSQFDLLETPMNAFTVDITDEPGYIVEQIIHHINDKNAQ